MLEATILTQFRSFKLDAVLMLINKQGRVYKYVE
jgi:hypothetical protein